MAKRFFTGIKFFMFSISTVFKAIKRTICECSEVSILTKEFCISFVQRKDNNGRFLCIGYGICQKVFHYKNFITVKKDKSTFGKVYRNG